MRSSRLGFKTAVLAAALVVAFAGHARAQGDGPHSLPLAPVGMNILVGMPLFLSGNFNPSQTVLIPGADVDVFALPVAYIRTFPIGGRFGRLFAVLPFANLDASAEILDPIMGKLRRVERGRAGIMDPVFTLHIGLAGAPALTPAEFVKRPKSSSLVAILGASPPLGTYDSSRLINLGTNRWTFRAGVGSVVPFSGAWSWESANTVLFFTENDDVFGSANARTQDPLFISENHIGYAFNPKWWTTLDLRYQVGGETATDGAPDDNVTNILGGGVSVGHAFNRSFSGYFTYGGIIAKKGDAKEQMLRFQIAYVF